LTLSPNRPSNGRPVFLAVALAVHAPTACALGNDTIFLRGSAFLGYDSNVFRVADGLTLPASLGGPDQGDMYYGLGAGVRLDLPISRQRVTADAYINKYWYSRFQALDYNAYGMNATWHWRAGNDWYGQLGAGVDQSRQYSTNALAPEATIPRLLRRYNALANARYALTPRWELQAGVSAYSTKYNDEVFSSSDFQGSTWDLGASYRSPRGNSTGFRLRYQEGRWPNRSGATATALGAEYQQYTLSAVVDWHLSGRSRLYGDVGYTVQSRQDAQQGDFNGPSGTLVYDYLLSGRTTLRTSIFQIRGPTDADFATYTRTTGVTFSSIYELTGKIQLQGSLAYSEVDYLGEARTQGASTREFQYWSVGASGVYRVTRTVNLNGGLSYYWRTSSVEFGDYHGFIANIRVGAEF
jgi:hypothetical protein